MGLRLGVGVLGFRVQGTGFRVQGLGGVSEREQAGESKRERERARKHERGGAGEEGWGGGMARDLERGIAANVGKLAEEDLGHDPVIFVAERDAEDGDHLVLLAPLQVNRLVVAVWDLECFVCRSRSAHGLEVVEETAR